MAATSSSPTIGFTGAGRMATALARGLIQAGFTSADRIRASDVSAEARTQFKAQTQASCAASNGEAVTGRDVVVLAVKPQHVPGVLDDIRHVLTHDQLVVSIAAGVTLATLSQSLGEQCRLIRVMPNTPCLVGSGASAFARGASATDDDAAVVSRMLSTVGIAIEVPESQLDAVTGLSGSGPAYVFQMIEALSDGGVRAGLPRQVASQLAAQTVLGAARMVLETGQHPAQLKDAVASPGGTTIAGLEALERGGMRAALIEAVAAATARSQELGRS